jgi:class 3 adenylate cyclase
MNREQAVLVFTDIVDSVRLQKHAGAEVYRRLKRHHDQLINSLIGCCPGAEIIESTGDGFYLRFPTCSLAVETCLRFQYQLKVDNTEDYRLRVRVGIHSGEVLTDSAIANRFLGMAPNITARVMSLALPGQILMTSPVYQDAIQYVRQHPHVDKPAETPTLRWVNHGQYVLKGEVTPISIFEVGAVGIAPLTAPHSSEKATRLNANAEFESGNSASGAIRSRPFVWYGTVASIALAVLFGPMIWNAGSGEGQTAKQSNQTDVPLQGTTPEPRPKPDELARTAPQSEVEKTKDDSPKDDPPDTDRPPVNPQTKGADAPPSPAPYVAKKPVPVLHEPSSKPEEQRLPDRKPTQPAPAPPAPKKTYTVTLTRLICDETSDLDDMDQLVMDLRVDQAPVPIKYPHNHAGTPCVNLKTGQAWRLEKTLSFQDGIEARFRDLDGVASFLGRITIGPDTIENGISSTVLERGGLAKHRYRLEWRLEK